MMTEPVQTERLNVDQSPPGAMRDTLHVPHHDSARTHSMARDRSSDKGPKVPLQDTLRLSGRGAGMLLGELEHALMEAAWALGRPATARELHGLIVKNRPIEQITAVTVLNRLVSPKRLMKRAKVDDVFNYRPTLLREEFMQRASRHVAERVLTLGADAVTASIVDVLAERDPNQLQELGRLVRRKLRERDERRGGAKESKESKE